MKDNIILKENTQYFSDITYYAVPPNKSNLKIFVLLAFNKNLYKTILCNISLIYNENKETFISIFNFLKNKFNFYPPKITIDYSMSLLKANKYCFPDAKIVPCFFHFMQNQIKKLPELRNKNKVIKNYAKDLLGNVRLICFINLNNIESFYDSMKTKYRSKFPNYFKYFDKYYINNNARFNKIWNYNEVIYNNLNKLLISILIN